jgi:hypothetical protein
MTTRPRHGFSSDQESHWTPTLVIGLLLLGALGYIAVVPSYVAAPEMNEASWFALTDQAIDAGTTRTETAADDPSNAQTEDLTTAAASVERAR